MADGAADGLDRRPVHGAPSSLVPQSEPVVQINLRVDGVEKLFQMHELDLGNAHCGLGLTRLLEGDFLLRKKLLLLQLQLELCVWHHHCRHWYGGREG